VTLTQDLGRILAALHQVKIEGTADFIGAIQVAQVRLIERSERTKELGEPKNTRNTTPKRMGRLDKTIVFNVLIIVKTLACDFFVTLWRELER